MNLLRTFVISAGAGLLLSTGCARPKTAATTAATGQISQITETVAAPAEHAELSGTWNYSMTNGQGTVTGVLTIQRGGNAGYTGRITTNEVGLDSETIITKAQLTGSAFTYEGVVRTPEGDIPFTMTGTIRGNQLEGQNAVQYQNQNLVYTVKATRK